MLLVSASQLSAMLGIYCCNTPVLATHAPTVQHLIASSYSDIDVGGT